ncbi:unnamed protein product [Urochloa humidicola]
MAPPHPPAGPILFLPVLLLLLLLATAAAPSAAVPEEEEFTEELLLRPLPDRNAGALPLALHYASSYLRQPAPPPLPQGHLPAGQKVSY